MLLNFTLILKSQNKILWSFQTYYLRLEVDSILKYTLVIRVTEQNDVVHLTHKSDNTNHSNQHKIHLQLV